MAAVSDDKTGSVKFIWGV